MLGNKEQVDKHVYHLLAKCCNLNERKSKALEIAKLYHGVSEFATAKSYVEGYLEFRPDSVPAYTLLAKIQEDMDDLSGALGTYKSLRRLTNLDKSTTLHACFLAQESQDISEVEFWSGVAQDMFPTEKITFLLKEKVLTRGNKVPELLRLLESQLLKDESDSEVCIRLVNLLYKSGSIADGFSRCLNCINAGRHFGIASWFHNCLSLLEPAKVAIPKADLPRESLYLVRAVCLMELIRVTSQTSCLSDMHQLLVQLEVVSSELSKLQSKGPNTLNEFAVIWLNFYGGVYAQRRFMNKCTESSDFPHFLAFHFYQRVSNARHPDVTPGSSIISASLRHHLRRECSSICTQATYLVHLFSASLDKTKPTKENATSLDSLTWKELISLTDGVMSENFTLDAYSFDTVGQKTSKTFEMHGSLDEYLTSPDCLNLIMWICAQQLSFLNVSDEDFTLSLPRLEFLLKSVNKLFPKLEFSCPSPVFGSPTELKSNSNANVDQLCQIDVICFLITCFLYISTRSLSKTNSSYAQSLGSQLAFKSTISGVGLDFLFLPLCLIPTVQLATSAQRSWWSLLTKNILEYSSQNKLEDENRAFFQCGLNQLRLIFHSTRCLNYEGGIMSPSFLFRVAQGLTKLMDNCSSNRLETFEPWPLQYWLFALKNHILGFSAEQSTPVIQSHNASFCSGYTKFGTNRCFSPMVNRSMQCNKTEYAGSHILFLIPSNYNSWCGVSNDSNDISSLCIEWCKRGWLWCLNTIEDHFQTSREVSNNDKKLVKLLNRLSDHNSSICDEAAYSRLNKILVQLSKSNEFTSLTNTESPRIIHNQQVESLQSNQNSVQVSRNTYSINESNAYNSISSVLSSSDTKEMPTTVSPIVQMNNPHPNSCSVTTNNKDTESLQLNTMNSINQIKTPSQISISPPLVNTPICSTNVTSENPKHNVNSTLSCSLTEFCKSLQNATGVPSPNQITTTAYRQDSCLTNLISVWQTLVSGLSCQLAETKAELTRSRELNEQLSKQLNETSKQLSDAVNKFIEFEKSNRIVSTKPSIDITATTGAKVFETPIRELSLAISELRHWLPEGMAAAACAAVDARLTTSVQTPVPPCSQRQLSSHSEVLIQSNNTAKSVQEKPKLSTFISSPKSKDKDSEQSPEAYEPDVDFTPAIETLPDLVELRSEEEDEQRLFCERARLFHWDKSSESWKTRGLGDAKILKNPKTCKCRLVMRRDQVKKVCANHFITPSIKLTLSTKDQKMAMWAVKDYSESTEGIDELFMIQFKSPEILNNFSRIFSECTTETNIVNTSVKLISDTGNKPSLKNDTTIDVKSSGPMTESIQSTVNVNTKPLKVDESKNTVQSIKPSSNIDLSKFAPKLDSWECPTCLLYHDSSITVCSACCTGKPGSSGENSTVTSKATLSTSLFGGILQNSGGFVFGNTKGPEFTTTTTSANITDSVTIATATVTTSIAHKPIFSFVATSPKQLTNAFPPISSSQTPVTKSFLFTSPFTTNSSVCAPSIPTFSTPLVSNASANEKKTVAPSTGFTFSFGNALSKLNETNNPSTVNFSTPTLSSSHHNDDNDDDKVELLDDSKLTFKPVLEVMPQKIEVVTGEENDDVIFCQRAKLYRWDNSTWHERGVGDLKLLRSTITGVIRCVMRRDHVLKVCCNHVIGAGMHLKPMNTGGGRAWSWWAIDYSEQPDEANKTTETDSSDLVGGGRRETFAARFKLTEHSDEFRSLFEEAVQTAENRAKISQSSEIKLSNKETVDLDQNGDDTDSDVVVVELPLKVSDDQLSRARRLKLPDEFYSFENGHITGESEYLTAREEAEEDALLEAAVKSNRKNCTTATEYSDSDSTIKLTPTSKQQNVTTEVQCTKVVTTSSSPMYIPQVKGLISFSTLSDAASKDSQPKWGSPTNAPTWSNAGAQLFTKPVKAVTEHEDGDSSDTENDPHYEPIVPLPKLVEVKTGEEEELCIFLRRCRAYRYVDKAWKERGVGEVKVLVQPRTMPTDAAHFGPRDIVPLEYKLTDIKRARILMRRDQVLKLCLNHPISHELPVLKPMGNMAGGNSLCWVGEDYSEGSASLETLAVRFKLDTDAEEFKAAVARAQAALSDS
ncbi:unnamed protein product [Schistosoma rodhaini]|uniref:RanBD1 domain-containing protein n=3 Tax=Schistosoma rodhaini TaxID=6188 RepID=A0AA85FKY4_9TREM|nr:unnamed protein product [Schistosoma rodhaini]